MNIADFTTVERLVKIRTNLVRADKEADNLIERMRGKTDPGGVLSHKVGYSSFVCTNSDGSGPTIDLSNCYIALELANATKAVIATKLALVNSDLEKLGVKV